MLEHLKQAAIKLEKVEFNRETTVYTFAVRKLSTLATTGKTVLNRTTDLVIIANRINGDTKFIHSTYSEINKKEDQQEVLKMLASQVEAVFYNSTFATLIEKNLDK